MVRDHVTALGAQLIHGAQASPQESIAVALADAAELARGTVPIPTGLPLVAVTSSHPIPDAQWRAALDHGARTLLSLPAQSDALLERLSAYAKPARSTLVVGVAGACGGAGASSFAARLAAAARGHGQVTLIDADPLGGGLDLLVEAPALHGVSWQDVDGIDPRDGQALREGLPSVDDVRLLVRSAGSAVDPPRLQRALTAISTAGGVAVVDCADVLLPTALPHLDLLLLVCPTTEHAARAAQRRLNRWSAASGLTHLVARCTGPLGAADLAAQLSLPLAASFRDSGSGTVPLLDVRRGGADRACRQLMARWCAGESTR